MNRPLPPYDAIPAAWAALTPEQQADIGCSLVEYCLAAFVGGDNFAECDHYGTEAMREDAGKRESALLNSFDRKMWALFPQFFGEEGCDPPWAWHDQAEFEERIRDREAKIAAHEAEIKGFRLAIEMQQARDLRTEP